MPAPDLRHQRLQNQHLAGQQFTRPADIVRWLGAVQAQDYSGAKWALGQRLKTGNDALIEKAFIDGDFIRTHVMRPTWHFVAPEDVRWMLDLTAKRIRMHTATRLRFFELDDKIFAKCADTIIRLLQGGKQLVRTDVAAALKQVGISTDEQRFIHIMMEMELQQVVCSGGVQGKQLTYALLDERVPKTPAISRDEALANLAERYFTSHGPASLQDYAWWSGLTIADASAGLAMVKNKLNCSGVYWFAGDLQNRVDMPPRVLLLPNYDEYIVSYKDRSFAINEEHVDKADPRGTIFNNTVVINGSIAGIWRKAPARNTLSVQITPFKRFSKAANSALVSATKRYAKFLGVNEHALVIS